MQQLQVGLRRRMLFLFFHKVKKAPAANYATSDFDKAG